MGEGVGGGEGKKLYIYNIYLYIYIYVFIYIMNIYLKRRISTFLGWNFYTFLKMLTYEWDRCKTEGPLPYLEA